MASPSKRGKVAIDAGADYLRPVKPSLPSPAFGDPLPLEAAPDTLAFLARRRSASALTLGEPGPSADQLRTLLGLAARVPDHGKLSPWRFVILEGAAKAAFVAGLEDIANHRPDAAKASAKLGKIAGPPMTIAVVSRYTPGEIPEWEQRLSAGAVCMMLITAAAAMGVGANWITDWYAYDAEANRLLGLGGNERVAGFVHLGTPSEAPLERVRPEVSTLASRWAP
ncbi:MAG TPA: nitroreductase [Caulobacteraceae bacterium]|nr:nitroreductase [Caulobacteraceae bacterium]